MQERNRLLGHFPAQDPTDLSERARGIMTRNYKTNDLINLSKSLPDAGPVNYPSSRMKDSLNHSKNTPGSSNQEVSSMLRTMMPPSSTNSDIPLVAKGQMNGTFKIAFDNPKDALAFKNLLLKDGFETTYFGDGERHPMEHAGQKLNHIVRFENNGLKNEIPKEALQFLKEKFHDNNKVSSIVEQMGFERPKMGLAMHP